MTSGYIGTPLAAKLGIKAGHRVILIGVPRDWAIHDLPEKVHVSRRRGSPANVVVAFFHDAASLGQRIDLLSSTITVDGALWIAWPRNAAGHLSDITDNVVRNTVLPLGLVDVKARPLTKTGQYSKWCGASSFVLVTTETASAALHPIEVAVQTPMNE